MAELSDFCLGSDVIDSDGRLAGRLARVLVAEHGFELQAIVVKDETTFAAQVWAKESLFQADEVMIPIDAVKSATHDAIQLCMSAGDVSRQPHYVTYRLEPPTPRNAVQRIIEALDDDPPIERIDNKRKDQIELYRDEKVMLGRTGDTLGRIHDLLYDKGMLIGVVMRPKGLKRDVVLPSRFISEADDLALFADISASDIEQLKPFDA
jgi:hypothetical protein